MQVLFQSEFSKKLDLIEALRQFSDLNKASEETFVYALQLVEGVTTHQQQIDKTLQINTSHWSLNRLALVDKCLLRLAVFEMSIGELVPAKVAINEALEIAKKYSTSDSAAFINGVLDQILRNHSPSPKP